MKIKIIIIVFIILSIMSCQKQDFVRKQIETLKSTPVSLEFKDMQIKRLNYVNNAKWKLIIYSDTTECSSCGLRDLSNWQPFIEKAKEKSVDIIFIFTPSKKNVDVFNFVLKTRIPKANIVVDTKNIFIKRNPQIPVNPLLHIFLLNKDNEVVLVGNPLKNKEINKLFWGIVLQ